MSRFEAPPGIVTNGLVLNLDAGDPDSYTRSQPPYVEVLVVAGGGGGGGNGPGDGGGGAGGLIYNSAYQLTSAAVVTVTLGAGGSRNTQGNNSVFGSLTAIGGGYGGEYVVTGNPAGGNGGSGGGGTARGFSNPGGSGTAGQGFNGGYGRVGSIDGGGGGGGASQVGQDGVSNISGGDGGNGQTYSISGTSTAYAGGGGGGCDASGAGGNGGTGGGGEGDNSIGGNNATAGTSNTGGGGGGGTGTNTGGSGIIIVRYPGLPAATGGTITYLNGYTIHTFTTSGTFTPYLWNNVNGDSSYSGSLINGPTFNSYQNGGYLSFDGTDDYVINSNFNITPTNNELCISLWYNTPNNAAEKMLIDLCGSSNPSSDRDFFSIRQNWSANGKISCYFNSTTGFQYVVFPNQVVANTWNNIVYSKVGNTLNAYLNGTSVATTNVSGNIQTIQRYIIAQDNLFSGNLWSGIMANVMIYNKGLSQAEVTQNYNAQKSRFGL